ncbi:MAG: DUF1127 domain-containing protein [Rhodospirillaceae bacterium]|jgi:uncharacterized protein YjiS (DUF1127 family)|nr:DUF1127 domain-containing protein [Rhodospirillaceae bacterium]MBT3908634.1 DUF1127 domain-containing protein [Rhodospirillaceae bacterium]MBT5298619.1 DUF1127 domain-containing protein [Rhodospirillaceae bacterium]MBT5514741.1 DUF1127 domain-containing protein [Rhodospirillaceae bacterium]MBT6085042.1 DUF1127 domain-containing protein [Rhodospirillaceae bacterium]
MSTSYTRFTDRDFYTLFPYPTVPFTRQQVADTYPVNHVGFGEHVGRVIEALGKVFAAMTAKSDLRRRLMGMDARMLEDVGLTRGDIEDVVAGRDPSAPTSIAEAPVESADIFDFLVPSKPPQVEAIMRRAA